MSACGGWFAGQPELLAGIHLGHPTRHLFLPGRRLLLQAVQIRADLLPLPFRDPGELLFELKHGDGAHVGSLEESKAFATPDAARSKASTGAVRVAVMGPSSSFALAGQAPTARLPPCA